jgi:hypothetical protein
MLLLLLKMVELDSQPNASKISEYDVASLSSVPSLSTAVLKGVISLSNLLDESIDIKLFDISKRQSVLSYLYAL